MSPRLASDWARARAETDQLFSLVQPEFLYERPIAERHRIVFYIGHLEAFDWNLLHQPLGLPPFHAFFDKLFAFGIDPVDGGLPSDQPSDWPNLQSVSHYKQQVRSELDAALKTASGLDTLLHVAIEHRWMHAETLTYMLHQMPLEQRRHHIQPETVESAPVEGQWISIPPGPATLGIEPGSESFGWDNEFPAQIIDVPGFAVERYKVTNGQYLRFVEAGGYQERRYWTESDWAWKDLQNIEHPAFWIPRDGAFLYKAMFQHIPLPLDWPVYVSHAEASAYAKWAGRRLPTEAEWQRAAYGNGEAYPWGDAPPDASRGYFGMKRWDPSPVNAFPASRSAWGVEGLLANGWEWTATPFAPFPGFEPFPFYRGYSADFFDGKHFVMKGGSPRTESCMLRSSFRNWFQAHYQYSYAGFRCAVTE